MGVVAINGKDDDRQGGGYKIKQALLMALRWGRCWESRRCTGDEFIFKKHKEKNRELKIGYYGQLRNLGKKKAARRQWMLLSSLLGPWKGII